MRTGLQARIYVSDPGAGSLTKAVYIPSSASPKYRDLSRFKSRTCNHLKLLFEAIVALPSEAEGNTFESYLRSPDKAVDIGALMRAGRANGDKLPASIRSDRSR
jgi:hypothetical protein